MSAERPFTGTVEAVVYLWEKWLAIARARAYREQIPSPLELLTICRETGCSLPELESFARILDAPPALLLCASDAEWAGDVAAVLGLGTRFCNVPDVPVLWWVQGGGTERAIIRHGHTEREVSRATLPTLLSQEYPEGEPLEIEEFVPARARWRMVWVPHPQHFRAPDGRPRENEALLAQRAAFIIPEETPETLRAALTDLGQKLWQVARQDLSTADERRAVLTELATLLKDRAEELALRTSAAWRWLSTRLIEQIAQRKLDYQQALNRFEIHVASTRHLLSQYQKNWAGGLRALLEKHVQSRLGSGQLTAFLDPQKPGPQPDTFINAIGLPALQGKVDEFLTDQMAALVAGLSGLSAKLELRRIALGDVNTRWSLRPISSRLETLLKDKRVFPAETGKKSRIVGSLTGRKQQVLDERRAQISKAVRLVLPFIEQEFVEWSSGLIGAVESNIVIQLTAAMANRGLPDPDALRNAGAGLDRLEKAIHQRREELHSPEAITAEWLRLACESRLIPLYHSP